MAQLLLQEFSLQLTHTLLAVVQACFYLPVCSETWCSAAMLHSLALVCRGTGFSWLLGALVNTEFYLTLKSPRALARRGRVLSFLLLGMLSTGTARSLIAKVSSRATAGVWHGLLRPIPSTAGYGLLGPTKVMQHLWRGNPCVLGSVVRCSPSADDIKS